MADHKFIIKGTLPGLNEYLKAERKFYRNANGRATSSGNEMKRDYQMLISNAIRLQLKKLKIKKPIYLSYYYYEPNRKRDHDNVAGVAHKFIQDALVQCGIIENDGWDNIVGFSDQFFLDRHNPRIEVVIQEVEMDEH